MAHRPVPALVDRQGGLVMNILDFSCLVPPRSAFLKSKMRLSLEASGPTRTRYRTIELH
jgi:hypothetical protein